MTTSDPGPLARAKPGYWRRGEPFVWASGGALAVVGASALLLAAVVAANALPVFWPAPLEEVTTRDGARFLGTPLRVDRDPVDGVARRQYKTANRDLSGGADFRWTRADDVAASAFPAGAVRVERRSHGDFHGRLLAAGQKTEADGPAALEAAFRRALAEARSRAAAEEAPRLAVLSKRSDRLYGLRMESLKWARRERLAAEAGREGERTGAAEKLAALAREAAALQEETDREARALADVRRDLASDTARFATADGREVSLPLVDVMRADWPNRMGIGQKLAYAAGRLWSLVAEPPREANTEGGVLPAIFGTVFLVMFMAAAAFPLGVTAGVYLREYARDNAFTRLVRVAVNNLAGIPSIVYGIFGLGFFVYGLGGGIDRFFYPERVEAGVTTFGTGGVLWAGLTLGLLTLPVVIVATEEALSTIPPDIRQGALALGATPWQALWRVSLPMASPGILTGFILAMARAAGEVAPLMLTGVVKSAPTMAIDGTWPFVHLERKFMHLGFHLYDVGFQSPNVEAARPMVYVTALLLLALVFALNAAAIRLRNVMRRRYKPAGL